jgi:glycerophosphoryl diester phosphodiesterase
VSPFGTHENTLDAFLKAVDLGASWLEMDATLNADGNLVLCHDLVVGGIPVHMLHDSDCQARGFSFLEEVHALVPSHVGFDLEVKFTPHDAFGPHSVEACMLWARYHSDRQVLLSSFDPASSLDARRYSLPFAWITHERVPLYEAVVSAVRLDAQAVVVHASSALSLSPTDPGLDDVHRVLRASGLHLWAWGVLPLETKILVGRGVTGMCTDDIPGVSSVLDALARE